MLKFVCAFAAVAACFTLSAEEAEVAESSEVAAVATDEATDEVDAKTVQKKLSCEKKGCGCGDKPKK